MKKNVTHIYRETAIHCKPRNSSDWDSCITRHLGYKHAFFQNVVSTKIVAGPYIFANT